MRAEAQLVNNSSHCEEIASLALEFGRLLMQAGASARHVDEIAQQVATGLGADRTELRAGYASLTISVAVGNDLVTQMCRVGPLGVNQSLGNALHILAQKILRGELDVARVRAELDDVVHRNRPRAVWMLAVAVGLACAAFGRLLGADWNGVGPIFAAAALSQIFRGRLASAGVNAFVSAATVAFLGAAVCGRGARWVGSETVPVDMAAAVLLLVPGVPALNAQMDILEGRPTLGSARAVWVVVYLVFVAAGVWFAQGLLGEGR